MRHTKGFNATGNIGNALRQSPGQPDRRKLYRRVQSAVMLFVRQRDANLLTLNINTIYSVPDRPSPMRMREHKVTIQFPPAGPVKMHA